LPISAIDTISLAFQHTKRQLVQPFLFWQWARLAIVGLLAGEMGSGGSINFPSNFQQRGGSPSPFPSGGFPHIDPAILAGLIAVIVLSALVIGLVFMYIGSVMQFILFDSVLAKECHIRQGWNRRQTPGWKLFLWRLGFSVITFAATVILLGIPAGFAFAMGWFKAPREHLLGLILGGIILFFVFMIFAVAVAVVHVLTKDFVVPQMALEGIGAVEGWRRLWPMIQAEKGGYAVYIGMKIVLAMGAAIIIGLASFIMGLLFAVPTVLLAVLAIFTGKTAGLTWNVYTITIAVVVGCILFALLMYLMSLVAVPAIVFFPAYSIYFFAARYRPLSLVLYPPPPPAAVWVPSGTPPQEPPPLAPAPAPG
jgi:hypothetical protein